VGFADCQQWVNKVETAIKRSDGRALRWLRKLTGTYIALRDDKGAAPKEVERCRALVADTLTRHAVKWHRQGQRTKDRHALELARSFYGEYVRAFPGADDAYEVTFYYAELLFKLQEWDLAAGAYADVVKRDPKGRHSKKASYGGLMACKQLINIEEQVQARAPKKRRRKKDHNTPQKISAAHLRFLAAVKTYLELAPGDPMRVPLMYRQARTYYKHNHYDKAVKIFAAIVTGHPDHELAEYAGNLLLDSLNLQRKYKELNQWVVVMLKEPKLAKGDFLRQLTKLRMGGLRKAAEKLQKAKRYGDCGQAYLKIADAYPKSPRAPEVLYNAALCFEAAKQYPRSFAARKRLIDGYPGSRLTPRAMYMVAALHHALKQTKKAAEAYEKFVHIFPGEKESFESIQNALVFRLQLGHRKEALADLETMQRNYGVRRKYVRRVTAATFTVGTIHEKKGDHAAVIRYYEVFLKKWARRGEAAYRVMALEKIGRAHWLRSCPVKAVHASCLRPGRRGKGQSCGALPRMKRRRAAQVKKARLYLLRSMAFHRGANLRLRSGTDQYRLRLRQAMDLSAAWAAFYLADTEHEPLLGLSLPRGKRLDRRLEEESKKIIKARAAYLEVIKLKQGEPALAALVRMTQIQASLARALCKAGDGRAAEQQKKAATTRKVCADKAKELKLQKSPWAAACAVN